MQMVQVLKSRKLHKGIQRHSLLTCQCLILELHGGVMTGGAWCREELIWVLASYGENNYNYKIWIRVVLGWPESDPKRDWV
ncbi:hypothetical protein L2E82_06262 [Cichorium intybus]|uniref:Uncharacterized protein n=1 Tax=Cichorium intybus TaxID=13427 RepID=A0ACB9HAS4_CICIN|nr:hypothetical protein L2E82_06262 [Cichorium intybus]